MRFRHRLLIACIGFSVFGSFLNAQQPASSASPAVVPRLVNFSGRATDSEGKIITGIAGATFAIYKDEYEGPALWLETQNIQADAKGNYIVQLGATKPEGMPLDLFTSGNARWLGVSINNGSEQPRIFLLSVPYALKAADAETIGGLPPSAFVRASSTSGTSLASTQAPELAEAEENPLIILKTVKTYGGTSNFFPLWTNATTLGTSALFQSSSGQLGLGTTTPTQALDLGKNNNMVIRVDPGNDTTQANAGYQLIGRGAKGIPNTWFTYTASVAGGFGVPANSYSIWQYPPNAQPGCCLNRFTILPAESSTDTGGTMAIDQNGNLDQTRSSGGAVKAMLHFSPYNGGRIISCFNSTLTGAAATTPPCGFAFDITGTGDYIFDFGFEVDDRIYSATAGTPVDSNGIYYYTPILSACGNQDGQCDHTGSLTNNQVEVAARDSSSQNFATSKVHLIIY